MKRVLLVQPSMQPPGGGNGVAAWVLQALVPEHRVTVLSWQRVDIEPINRFFGTHLKPGDFDTLVVPWHWRVIPDHLAGAGDARQAVVVDALHAPGQQPGSTWCSAYSMKPITAARASSTFTTRRTCGRGPTVDLRWYHAAQCAAATLLRSSPIGWPISRSIA